MALERAFTLCKPDAVALNLVGKCLEMWQRRGLSLLALDMRRGTPDMFRQMYFDRQTYSFWDDLLAFLLSGPVVAAVWQAPDANARVRQVVGEKDPLDSAPGTIRGSLPAQDEIRTLVHGSRDPEEAEAEIALWFPALARAPATSASDRPSGSAPYSPATLSRLAGKQQQGVRW